MILDQLNQWRLYAALSPRFTKAFQFLETFRESVANGRHELDGDDAYALVQRYTTLSMDKAQFESHRKYIDVQYVHAGKETILWAPLEALTKVTMPYDAEQEAALYELVPNATPLRMSAGQFAIFFPADGHVPCRIWDEPTPVTKIVVKVRL